MFREFVKIKVETIILPHLQLWPSHGWILRLVLCVYIMFVRTHSCCIRIGDALATGIQALAGTCKLTNMAIQTKCIYLQAGLLPCMNVAFTIKQQFSCNSYVLLHTILQPLMRSAYCLQLDQHFPKRILGHFLNYYSRWIPLNIIPLNRISRLIS